ncbi:hypothetical protein GCM10018779_52850 [Streptomyces griseocarneus]|nr:hypothetical protein GCM10018779_52850 [Streptomyces griseocarneus]
MRSSCSTGRVACSGQDKDVAAHWCVQVDPPPYHQADRDQAGSSKDVHTAKLRNPRNPSVVIAIMKPTSTTAPWLVKFT